MKRKLMIFLVLGIVFLLYYLLCGKYGGFHLSVLFIWLAAGIICLILAGLELHFGCIPAVSYTHLESTGENNPAGQP